MSVDLADLSDGSWGDPPWPEKFVNEGLRDIQVDAIAEICDAYLSGVDVVLLEAPTGCLAGDTILNINRAGKGFSMRIDEVYERFHGAGSKTRGKVRKTTPAWRVDIPTKIARSNDGLVKLGVVENVVLSGVKPTYTLTTGDRTIRATATHPFLTVNGWVPLGDLTTSSEIVVKVGRSRRSSQPKNHYRMMNGLFAHPFAGRRGVSPDKGGFSRPYHVLVAEARLNDLDFDVFIKQIKSDDIEGLVFLDPAVFHVHHLDENHRNNKVDNLQVLTIQEHLKHHADVSHVLEHTDVVMVNNIKYFGEEMTYDVTLADDPHNFIANGFVVHNSGKTVIAEAIRRIWSPRRALYVANTKGLQDQFMRDFSAYARTLKGRSNYPTYDYPEKFGLQWDGISAADCHYHKEELPACGACGDTESPISTITMEPVKMPHCDFCHPTSQCPYRIAKANALDAPLTVTNTAYFIAEANSAAGFSNMPLVIIDEAKTLRGILTGQIEVEISKRSRDKYDINPPDKKTVAASWGPWVAQEALPKVRAAMGKIPGNTRNLKLKRERVYLERLAARLVHLTTELELGNAIYDGYSDGDIKFRPIKVGHDAPEMLWRHGSKWLLMDAAFVDIRQVVEDLGIEEAGLSWRSVHVPSTFPKENRPIHIKPVTDMKFKEKDTNWPIMIEGVREVLAKHPDERVLIHTVSYALARYLKDGLGNVGRDLLIYDNAKEREATLDKYLANPGSVLLAPSMERGVDLPYDACGVVIVAKVPYPNTQDKVIQKILHNPAGGGQTWYAIETVTSIIQMTGRGMRAPDDHCHTYILDRAWMKQWNDYKHLYPKWWTEALDWTGGAMV